MVLKEAIFNGLTAIYKIQKILCNLMTRTPI